MQDNKDFDKSKQIPKVDEKKDDDVKEYHCPLRT